MTKEEMTKEEMTKEEMTAYKWALGQTFQSVAARYAKTLAECIRRADAFKCAVYELEEAEPEADNDDTTR